MQVHQKIPFLRILTGVFSGIMLEMNCSPGMLCWSGISSVCLVFIAVYNRMGSVHQWRFRSGIGLVMHILLICLGGLTSCKQSHSTAAAPIPADINWLLARIHEGPSQTKTGSRYTANLFSASDSSPKALGSAFLYCSGMQHNQFKAGDIILIQGKPVIISPRKNTYGFDFYNFAKRKGVTQTINAKADSELALLGSAPGILEKLTGWLRQFLLDALRKNIPEKELCGLAEAMLTGYREDLNRELLQAYTDTGVVHIIAISGLHLGLIFWLADLFLRKVVSRKIAPVTGLLFILPLLWIFAIMTGSSASVLRSVLMFTFMMLGNALGKRTNSMNTLLATACILLISNPNLLADIGFQLSYAAVGSILLFEKPIRRLLYLRNKTAVYCWSMVTITLAAQVLTTPFVIFHFHRFPLLFLFSNLVAVPLSSIILILEIVLCLADAVGIGAAFIGLLVSTLMDAMNGYVLLMNKIDFNLIDGIHISLPMMILFVLFGGFVLFFLRKPDRSGLMVCLLTFLGLAFCRLTENYRLTDKNEWIILPVPGASCLIHRHGNQATILIRAGNQQLFLETTDRCKQALEAMGIKKVVWGKLPESPAILHLPVISGEHTGTAWILSDLNNFALQPEILPAGNPPIIVADGSNKLWKIREWQKQSQELHLRFISTSVEGAVTMSCQHKP